MRSHRRSPLEFSKPDPRFLERVRPELVDYWGQDAYSTRVVHSEGRHWLIKTRAAGLDDGTRDYLAYLLGRGWLNIPEVRLLSAADREVLSAHHPTLSIESHAAWLVRLVQDHQIEELPIRDLTRAVAGELVFSLWIRRRDAHLSNRALVRGVPMFFDFGAAFTGEPANRDLDTFCRDGSNSGYVGSWRLLHLRLGRRPHLARLRRREYLKPLALHPVHSPRRFTEALSEFVRAIKARDRAWWGDCIARAGCDAETAGQIDRLLAESQASIDEGLARVSSILRRGAGWPVQGAGLLKRLFGASP